MALQGEVLHRVSGLAKRVPVKPVSVPVPGQHPPRVRLAVDGGVGKPAGERQDVSKDRRWRVGQLAQLRIRIEVARRKQLHRAQAAGQRAEEQKHLFQLNVGRQREADLRQAEDQRRVDPLKRLGLDVLPKLVVVAKVARV